MELDLASRQLPRGYLVNRAGLTCKINRSGTVYCGAKVMVGVRGCDGWCGPTNGP
jgi:hypothetical protein